MQRSKVEMYAHLVWATRQREPFITDNIERHIYRCIQEEAQELKCVVLALNGMPDRIHLVVQLHSTLSVARLAQAVKGNSSRFANDMLGFAGAFDWQDHYAAFSWSHSHLDKVISYVQNQKQRHQKNRLWSAWEETTLQVT